MTSQRFRYVDLFAGIGGFHAVLSALGGECVYAVEKDASAARVYQRNWGQNPLGDITEHASEESMEVPSHDVLAAGFPCQPFSKSGAQRGMDETRGTLFWNILQIIRAHHPSVVILENVRNLAGPRHEHEWEVIIAKLQEEGYLVSTKPAVFSPHLLPRSHGGRPQTRSRVYITATYAPAHVGLGVEVEPPFGSKFDGDWSPRDWNLIRDLPLESGRHTGQGLTSAERLWIDAWGDLIVRHRESRPEEPIPSFPIWADYWRKPVPRNPDTEIPEWKINFHRKNRQFYLANREWLDLWLEDYQVLTEAFPPSRRKLEWQAQEAKSIWHCFIQLRPSGVRVKSPTYLPALVAITQKSIIGPRRRKLSIREAARLQGLPDEFTFGDESESQIFKQLGNGISTGALWYVIKKHVERDREILFHRIPQFVNLVESAPSNPDEAISKIIRTTAVG